MQARVVSEQQFSSAPYVCMYAFCRPSSHSTRSLMCPPTPATTYRTAFPIPPGALLASTQVCTRYRHLGHTCSTYSSMTCSYPQKTKSAMAHNNLLTPAKCAGGRSLHQLVDPSAMVAAVAPTTPFQPVTQAIWASGNQFMQGPDQVRRGPTPLTDGAVLGHCCPCPPVRGDHYSHHRPAKWLSAADRLSARSNGTTT